MDEARAFAERIDNLRVIHPKIEVIWRDLDSRRRCKPRRHLCILGESGVGKSYMAEKYVSINSDYIDVDGQGTEIDIKPILLIEVPEPFTAKEFYESIVEGLGAPHLPRGSTTGEVKRQVLHLIKMQRVEMMIADQLDFILDSKGFSPKKCMDTMIHFSNISGISLVCMGQPTCRVLLDGQFQTFRRFPRRSLTRFNRCDNEFRNFLTKLEEQIKPPQPIGLGDASEKYAQFLHDMSKGYVGILTPVIQEAYNLLGVNVYDFTDYKSAKLTMKALTKAYENIMCDTTDEQFANMINKKLKE